MWQRLNFFEKYMKEFPFLSLICNVYDCFNENFSRKSKKKNNLWIIIFTFYNLFRVIDVVFLARKSDLIFIIFICPTRLKKKYVKKNVLHVNKMYTYTYTYYSDWMYVIINNMKNGEYMICLMFIHKWNIDLPLLGGYYCKIGNNIKTMLPLPLPPSHFPLPPSSFKLPI